MFHNVTYADATPQADGVLEYASLLSALAKNQLNIIKQIIADRGGGTIDYYDFQLATAPPSVLLFSQGQFACLCLTGSQNWQNLLGAFIGGTVADYAPGGEFVNAYCYSLYNTLSKLINPLLPKISSTGQVVFCGHSLGGAVATIFAAKYSAQYGANKCQLITFGAPKVFAGNNFVIPKRAINISLTEDLFSHLPPKNIKEAIPRTYHLLHVSLPLPWNHVGKMWELRDDNTYLSRPVSDYAGDVILIATNIPFTSHKMDQYLRRIMPAWTLEPTPRDDATLMPIASSILTVAEPNLSDAIIDPRNFVNIAAANNILFPGENPGPIRIDNITVLTSVAITVSSVIRRSQSNISDIIGNITMANVWKCTFLVSNGDIGSSESHYLRNNQNKDCAITAARQLAQLRANLLANDGSTPNRKSLGTPCLTHIRISDAANVRTGFLVPASTNSQGLFGPKTGGNGASDWYSTALSIRMRGVNTVDPSITRPANLLLPGIPDDLIKGGIYQPSFLMATGVNFSFSLGLYLNMLANGDWGFLGSSSTETKRTASTAIGVDGMPITCSVDTTGWQNGDKLRISGSNAKGFNGVTKINVPTSGTIALLGRVYNGQALFTTCQVQRVQKADKTKPQDFYTYVNDPNDLVKISDRDYGRPFNPVSFRRRRAKTA